MAKTPPMSSSSPSNVSEPSTVANQEIKYKGVRLRKWGKYVSEIRLPNSRERIWLGSYDTAEKAARAFDAALFCLRGRNAKFNFPDDPPNIAGGQSLTPGMIQTVAQQYANSCSTGPVSDQLNMDDGGADFRVIRAMELVHDTSPSSEAGASDEIDWSFLDTLGSNNNSGHFPDFGLFHEPGDMYMPPHYHESHITDDGNHYYDNEAGNGGGVQSFDLWSF